MSNFGRWKKPAPPLWSWFKKMQERARYFGIACAFAYDENGYQQFAAAIGPLPRAMRQPTVGRLDHTKGYVPGNFCWQEQSDNSRESFSRHGVGKLGTAASARSAKKNTLQVVACPHCGREGRLVPMRRWHFENCRE